MKVLFNSIKDRITTGVTEIQSVHLYNNQLENSSESDVLIKPSVLIQFPDDILYTTIKNSYQVAEVKVRIHIIIEAYDDYKLEVFDLKEVVNKKLHGFSTTNFTTLIRVNERVDNDFDNCISYIIDYTTKLYDQVIDEDDAEELVFVSGLTLNTDLDIDNPIIRTGDGKQ